LPIYNDYRTTLDVRSTKLRNLEEKQTMRKIIAVDGWATVKEFYNGKYRNEQGLDLRR